MIRLHNRRSPVILFLLLLLWSLILGWGMASAMETSKNIAQSAAAQSEIIGTVDPVPDRYKLGQEIYLKNCSSCHIAISPAVLPNETWRHLLEDLDQHYGTRLPNVIGPDLILMWNYLLTFSRSYNKDEPLPYRISESRYFKALHPRVEVPRPVKMNTCITCHPGAAQYNFRQLIPEWENSN